MAEDLGFIEVRLPEDSGGGAVQSAAGMQLNKTTEKISEAVAKPFANLKEALNKVGSLKDIFTTATSESGFRQTIGSASEAAKTIGGTAGAAIAAGVAAVGLGVAAVVAIKSFVGGILDRVNDLARINAMMAREAAQNKLAEIARDMKEARVMGPLYSMVAGMARSIMNQIQPLLLLIKTALVITLIPIMKLIEVVLSALNLIASYIVQGMGLLFTAIGQALQLLGSLVLQFSQNIPSLLDPGGMLSSIFNAIGQTSDVLGKGVENVGNTLDGIAQMMRNQQNKNQNVNAWATDTLSALAGAIQPGAIGTRKRQVTI